MLRQADNFCLSIRKVCKTFRPRSGQALDERGSGAMGHVNLGLDLLPKKTRKEVFLEEMN